MRETISLNIGSAGTQIGNSVWELYCMEHGIGRDGKLIDTHSYQEQQQYNDDNNIEESSFRNFFSESSQVNGKFIPRTIFIDTDGANVSDLKKYGTYKDIYRPSQFIGGKEDASDNFARGCYTVGRELNESIMEKIRSMVEECDSFQGFHFYRSLSGGTGSGLTSSILQKLSDNYPKISKVDFVVMPSYNQSNCTVSQYNATLAFPFMIEHCDFNVLFDNETMYDIIKRTMSLKDQSFSQLNSLMSQVSSTLTAPMRFKDTNADSDQIHLNSMMHTIPYPKLHFLLPSFTPLITKKNSLHNSNNLLNLLKSVYSDSLLCKGLMELNKSKYLSSHLFCRTDGSTRINSGDISKNINELKKSAIKFVDWAPNAAKISINHSQSIEFNEFAQVPTSLCALTNTTAVSSVFDKIKNDFTKSYRSRSFVHWFVGEGLEENEMRLAHDSLIDIFNDYNSIHTSQNSLIATPEKRSLKKC